MASSSGLAFRGDRYRLQPKTSDPLRDPGSARLDDSDRNRIVKTVETEIIPRLLLLHGPGEDCGPAIPPSNADVAFFAQLLLATELDAAASFVSALQAKGASTEMLFMQVFAPAARLLGDLWREDLVSFAEVTIGLTRLQQLLHTLRNGFECSGGMAWNGYRALLAPAPGEQHSFGLNVVESFLLRGGWQVETLWGARETEIIRTVRREPFDLLGISLSCDVLLDRLGATIEAVRRASANRGLKILVGGRYFVAHPDKVASVGADACAIDAKDAAMQASRLIGRTARVG